MGFRTRVMGKNAQVLLLAVLVSGLSAQISESRPRIGVPEDWTHHRIKFNRIALRQHPELAGQEPRAAMQLYREAFIAAQSTFGRSPVFQSFSASTAAPHRDWSISLGTGRLQPGAYPAKWQSDPTLPPSCTADFVIYGLNVAGVTGGQPSIVGLNRLYSDGGNPLCPGFNQPNFLFSYNTTTLNNGRILTSPVLSLDGKKVAFVETSTVAGARNSTVHVLKIPTSGSQATATPSVAPPVGAVLDAPLAAASNTRSSPWVDYKNDILYVGLDNGRLYKVTGIFKGTPTTVATAPWPILIANNNVLSSPVLDANTGRLFIGAANGRVFALNVNSPAAPALIQVGRSAGPNPGIYDSPMFDATGGTIFAITSNDSVLTGASVVQIDATTFSIVTRVLIGQGSTGGGATVNLFDGDFDAAYFNNPSTGHILVCGTGPADKTPYRYLLPFNGSGVLQPGSSVQLTTNAAARCSPVTEFFNSNIAGGTDFFFWGVSQSCPGFGAAGCIMSLTNGATQQSARQNGGTSGIVIDNTYVNATFTGGSSIYYSSGAAPDNAVKVTQQGLQ
jgi:hypothetical protein